MSQLVTDSTVLNNHKKPVIKITVSALFLAIAIVIKLSTAFYLPILGAAGLKIDFSGVFSAFPAILFGPWYGGAVFALADLLGTMIKPAGAYIPALTVTQFITGVLIGYLWKLILGRIKKSKSSKRLSAIAFAIFLLIGIFGAFCHASLYSDGVVDSFIIKKESLPDKGEIIGTAENSVELSPLSKLVCSLAQYSNDSLTLIKASSHKKAAMIVIPAAVDTGDGVERKVTAIGTDAFSSLADLHTVYIPASVSSIRKDAFENCADNLTIYTSEGSPAEKFAAENLIGCVAMSESEERAFLQLNSIASDAEYSSNDNYRKNLFGYIGFMTLGLEAVALVGILLIILGIFIRTKIFENNIYTIVLTVIFFPRLIVTTINTEILRQALAVWNGRAFWVLLIPRIGEEIISCIVSAYVIAILYSVYENKIAPKMPSLS